MQDIQQTHNALNNDPTIKFLKIECLKQPYNLNANQLPLSYS